MPSCTDEGGAWSRPASTRTRARAWPSCCAWSAAIIAMNRRTHACARRLPTPPAANYLAIRRVSSPHVVKGWIEPGRPAAHASSWRSRSAATGRRRDCQRGVVRSVDEASSIFRIDHSLGKEPVQNLRYFRFANSFLEPLGNRDHVSEVQITMAGELRRRGAWLYEELGAVRDVVQNHRCRWATILAMEPPVGADASTAQREGQGLDAMRVPSRAIVRGQYAGYRSESGVDLPRRWKPHSAVRAGGDRFVALGGRAVGRTVPANSSAGRRAGPEVMVRLRRPPQRVFDESVHANYVRFRLGPDRVAIALGARAKRGGEEMVGRPVEWLVCGDGRARHDDGLRAPDRGCDARRCRTLRAAGFGGSRVARSSTSCWRRQGRYRVIRLVAGARTRRRQ